MKARLVIATCEATHRREGQGQSVLELSAWTRVDAESFLGQLDEARGTGAAALAAIELDRIAGKLSGLGGSWTPLDIGYLIRLLADEPELLERDANDRELHIRSAMHRMVRRAELSPDREQLWSERGRRACALAAAVAVRGSDTGRPIGPVGKDALREALAELAGVTVGGEGGVSLREILERARRAEEPNKMSARKVLDRIEALSSTPSSDDLIELLVDLDAWRPAGDGTFLPADPELTLAFAAERLDDDWMWRRPRSAPW